LLDPIFAKHQIYKIRNAVVRLDSANADCYNQNADRFTAELDSLDAFIRSDLASCDKLLDFIAFYDTFNHFLERYDFRQHSILQGVSPEGEILLHTMQQIIRLANELDIHVNYSEDLIDGRFAEAIANDIPHGKVLVPSPIEDISKEEQAAGIRHIDKMKQNVVNLKEGLECR